MTEWEDRAGTGGDDDRRTSSPPVKRCESASNAIDSIHRGGSRLNHAVYDQLKERLLEGRYAAGERLSTEAL